MNQQNLTFDQYGYLTPAEPIPTDLATFERVFIQEFTRSTKRQTLFDRYLEHNAHLSRFLPGYTQWIGGSFVSRKLNPNDIDVLTFVDWQLYEQHKGKIDELRQWRLEYPKELDGYFVAVYPENHRQRFLYESDRMQWLFEWGRTHSIPRRSKGIIELITV